MSKSSRHSSRTFGRGKTRLKLTVNFLKKAAHVRVAFFMGDIGTVKPLDLVKFGFIEVERLRALPVQQLFVGALPVRHGRPSATIGLH